MQRAVLLNETMKLRKGSQWGNSRKNNNETVCRDSDKNGYCARCYQMFFLAVITPFAKKPADILPYIETGFK